MVVSDLKKNGFTLIELMIVVAVVAILAAVALPSYQEHVRKGARAAAQGFMMEIANREQQYFLDKRSFVTAISSLGLDEPKETLNRYTYAVTTSGPPPCFSITATATGSQVPDGNLTLDCTNAKTRSGVAGW